MQLIEITDRNAWDTFVNRHDYGHPLQLWGWGEAKRPTNWSPHRLVIMDGDKWVAGAQVLLWPVPRMGRFIAYVPRGPVAEPGSKAAAQLLGALVKWARAHKALYVRVEPAWTDGAPGGGWRRARHQLQLAQTYTIDLRKTPDELLEAMSRKHRQYIRKSERDGVSVRRVTDDDLASMYAIYTETAQRAGFGIHTQAYYEALHGELGQNSYLYLASFAGKPVAFLWLAAAGKTAYELYGGVTSNGAEIKANYFLKWQAMMELRDRHFEIYDFNGRLNEGVSRFKDGFGPDSTDYIGTWDYPLNLLGYQIWERLWPVAKPVGRHIMRIARGGHR